MRNMHGVLMSFRCISEPERVTRRKESPLIDQPVQFMSCLDRLCRSKEHSCSSMCNAFQGNQAINLDSPKVITSPSGLLE
jgi:hypothetical protein